MFTMRQMLDQGVFLGVFWAKGVSGFSESLSFWTNWALSFNKIVEFLTIFQIFWAKNRFLSQKYKFCFKFTLKFPISWVSRVKISWVFEAFSLSLSFFRLEFFGKRPKKNPGITPYPPPHTVKERRKNNYPSVWQRNLLQAALFQLLQLPCTEL